jgi:tetratricopeptide (TPR) repeat protein
MILPLLLLATSALDFYNQANTLFQQQRYQQAEAALNASLTADPNLTPALTLKGKLAMGLNRFDIARECFEKAAKLEPKSPYVQFLLGFFHYVDNDFVKAIPALELAKSLKPDDSRTHFYLALSYEGVAKPAEAAKLYQRTIELEATQRKPLADTHVAYGRLLFAQGDMSASAKQIARAIELEPKSRDAHYEQGRLYFEKSEWQKAIAAGEKAFQLPGVGTTDRQIHFLLARAYAKGGNRDAADKHVALFKASGASLRR